MGTEVERTQAERGEEAGRNEQSPPGKVHQSQQRAEEGQEHGSICDSSSTLQLRNKHGRQKSPQNLPEEKPKTEGNDSIGAELRAVSLAIFWGET